VGVHGERVLVLLATSGPIRGGIKREGTGLEGTERLCVRRYNDEGRVGEQRLRSEENDEVGMFLGDGETEGQERGDGLRRGSTRVEEKVQIGRRRNGLNPQCTEEKRRGGSKSVRGEEVGGKVGKERIKQQRDEKREIKKNKNTKISIHGKNRRNSAFEGKKKGARKRGEEGGKVNQTEGKTSANHLRNQERTSQSQGEEKTKKRKLIGKRKS